MKRNSLAWIVVGGSAFALATFQLAACSSSGGTGNPITQPDATGDSAGGDGSPKGDGSSKSDAPTTEDAGKDCGTAPKLRPRGMKDAGADGGDAGPLDFICPFSAASGQPWDYCQGGAEHCCVPFSGQSSCEATCPNASDGGPFNGRDFECLDEIDCVGGGGPVCCAMGVIKKDDQCNEYFGQAFKGSKCAASCDENNSEFVICQKDEHCSGGKTCVAMGAVGAQFGFCQ